MRVLKWLVKGLFSLVGAMFDLIGVAGISEDITQWKKWIVPFVPLIESLWGRIALVFFGTALIIWVWTRPPRNLRIKPQVDWSIRRAMDWITYESRWGWRDFARYHWFFPISVPGELRKKAASGAIIIQGRALGEYEFMDINRDYWNMIQFKTDDYLDTRDSRPDMPKIGVEFRTTTYVSVPRYDDYRVSSSQITAEWPKARWWYRWLMRCEWAGRYLLAWAKALTRWGKHVARQVSKP